MNSISSSTGIISRTFLAPIKSWQVGRYLDEEVIKRALKGKYQQENERGEELIRAAIYLYGPSYGLAHRIQKYVLQFSLFFPFYFSEIRNRFKQKNFVVVTAAFISSFLSLAYYFITFIRFPTAKHYLLYMIAAFGTGFFGGAFFGEFDEMRSSLDDYRNTLLGTVDRMRNDLFSWFERNKHFVIDEIFDATVRGTIESKVGKDPTEIIRDFLIEN